VFSAQNADEHERDVKECNCSKLRRILAASDSAIGDASVVARSSLALVDTPFRERRTGIGACGLIELRASFRSRVFGGVAYSQPRCLRTAATPGCSSFCSAGVKGASAQYAARNVSRRAGWVGRQSW